MLGLLVSLVTAALAVAGQAAPPTGVVTARIVDADTGQPVSGVLVTLNPAPVSASSGAPTTPSEPSLALADLLSSLRGSTTRTNTDGVFELTGVPQGRWRVQLRREGYVLLTYTTVVEIGAPVARPEIRLDRGGTIVGRVLDARGRPVTGVLVHAVQMVKSPAGASPGLLGSGSGGETNDIGEFRVPGLGTGQHYLVAQPRPNTSVSLLGSTPSSSGTTFVATYYPGFADAAAASPVTVSRGVTTSGLDFVMVSVAAYQVSGIVLDSAGQPAAGALVQLTQQPRTSFSPINQATSAKDGTFRIPNVPSGTYEAIASIPVIARSGTSVAKATSFAGASPVEVLVQEGNVAGVTVVARLPQ